ncbi:hypothetical protein K7432_007558 [Basidiobolus ranarum]|uniref:Uncharacterized protein n=1 Tax=Basidiobolus ranarum TaxID=34480 RepID=A0ABR2WT89_9FUNG
MSLNSALPSTHSEALTGVQPRHSVAASTRTSTQFTDDVQSIVVKVGSDRKPIVIDVTDNTDAKVPLQVKVECVQNLNQVQGKDEDRIGNVADENCTPSTRGNRSEDGQEVDVSENQSHSEQKEPNEHISAQLSGITRTDPDSVHTVHEEGAAEMQID